MIREIGTPVQLSLNKHYFKEALNVQFLFYMCQSSVGGGFVALNCGILKDITTDHRLVQ